MLIECKHWAQNLDLHDNQLIRYFNVSKAKFGVLTNGIIYKFYTDLVSPNIMDSKPFLEINMNDIKEHQIDELKKFHKSYFDINTILSSANELKYVGEMKNIIASEFKNPSADFVKYIGKQVYDGVFKPKVLDQFTLLLRKTFNSYISDVISDKLNAVMKNTDAKELETEIIENEDKFDSKIITTAEELEGFYIIKSILRSHIQADRIAHRDNQTYFSILIDNNNRKLVCRLYLNSQTNKKLVFVGDDKKEIVHKIMNIDEIYNHADSIIGVAERYK